MRWLVVIGLVAAAGGWGLKAHRDAKAQEKWLQWQGEDASHYRAQVHPFEEVRFAPEELVDGESLTIVQYDLKGCSSCAKMKSAYKSMFQSRGDIAVHLVKTPDLTDCSGGGFTMEEAQATLARCKERMRDFDVERRQEGVCSWPHIRVYSPEGRLIAGDSCTSRDGSSFVRRLLAS